MIKRIVLAAAGIAVLFCAPILLAAVAQNPLDLSHYDRYQAASYLKKLTGQSIKVMGVMKDADELKPYISSLLYEIPVYSKEGDKYTRYGFVCQRQGSSIVLFANDGYLPLYVKNNVMNKTVLARGKLVEVKRSEDLPKGVIFILDSLSVTDESSKTVNDK